MIKSEVKINHPGEMIIETEITADSPLYAPVLEEMADGFDDPGHAEIKAKFENGSLKLQLTLHTDDHVDHLRNQRERLAKEAADKAAQAAIAAREKDEQHERERRQLDFTDTQLALQKREDGDALNERERELVKRYDADQPPQTPPTPPSPPTPQLTPETPQLIEQSCETHGITWKSETPLPCPECAAQAFSKEDSGPAN